VVGIIEEVNMRISKNKELKNYSKPYIIAELGANHNGDMELAKKMIIEAKEAGADCVKFQSWSKDSVFAKKKYEDNYFIADDYRDRTDFTLEEIVEKYSISETELLEMKLFADEVGIDCSSTPFNKKEADFVVEQLKSPFIKVASMDLNNLPFLDYLARDKEMEGWDHKVSATKDELTAIVTGAKRINDALGSFRITATESDDKKAEFRRSIVITRAMKKGETVQLEDLDYKRPGVGLKPDMTEFIVGLSINKDLQFDHILTKEDFV